jgi:hypothetical protein
MQLAPADTNHVVQFFGELRESLADDRLVEFLKTRNDVPHIIVSWPEMEVDCSRAVPLGTKNIPVRLRRFMEMRITTILTK